MSRSSSSSGLLFWIVLAWLLGGWGYDFSTGTLWVWNEDTFSVSLRGERVVVETELDVEVESRESKPPERGEPR